MSIAAYQGFSLVQEPKPRIWKFRNPVFLMLFARWRPQSVPWWPDPEPVSFLDSSGTTASFQSVVCSTISVVKIDQYC